MNISSTSSAQRKNFLIFLAISLISSAPARSDEIEHNFTTDQSAAQFFFNHAVKLTFYDSWRVYQMSEKYSDEDEMKYAAEELSRRIFSWFVHVRKGHIEMHDSIDAVIPTYLKAIDPTYRDAFGDPYRWGIGFSPGSSGISFNLIGGGWIDSPEEYVELLNEFSDLYELEIRVITVKEIKAAKQQQINHLKQENLID